MVENRSQVVHVANLLFSVHDVLFMIFSSKLNLPSSVFVSEVNLHKSKKKRGFQTLKLFSTALHFSIH